jgi:TonB-dependent starch-binding outer membrane protein SusC
MKKIVMNSLPCSGKVQNLLLKMKLTILILLFSLLQVSATVYSQTTKFSLKVENKRIIDVLQEIEESSDFRFFYQNEQVNVYRQVSVVVVDQTVEQILDKMFAGQAVSYKVMDDNLILLGREKDLPKTGTTQQQQKSVSGKVTDSSGVPLPGVTVSVKGTTQGSITNYNGVYSISGIPENAVLLFSFVGMKSQEILVNNKTTIDVILYEEMIGVDEVIVVGYGTVKKENLTGSVDHVSSKELVNRPIRDVAQGLKGVIPNLNITETSGAPDATARINIRGFTGINSQASPLILVDGTPQDINQINPEDVESVSVLKDAASSAIYGSRAPYGVILITTRSGKAG